MSANKFWTHLNDDFPLYGADIRGSLINETEGSTWNLNRLESVLRWIH